MRFVSRESTAVDDAVYVVAVVLVVVLSTDVPILFCLGGVVVSGVVGCVRWGGLTVSSGWAWTKLL